MEMRLKPNGHAMQFCFLLNHFRFKSIMKTLKRSLNDPQRSWNILKDPQRIPIHSFSWLKKGPNGPHPMQRPSKTLERSLEMVKDGQRYSKILKKNPDLFIQLVRNGPNGPHSMQRPSKTRRTMVKDHQRVDPFNLLNDVQEHPKPSESWKILQRSQFCKDPWKRSG